MSVDIEQKLEKIPVIRNLMHGTQKVKLPWLEGLSLYDLLEIYIVGIVEGAITYRAGAVAFSFFMALFYSHLLLTFESGWQKNAANALSERAFKHVV